MESQRRARQLRSAPQAGLPALAAIPSRDNPVLLCLLDDMSANATAGWLTADVALNFGLPGLGALAANAEFKQMMAFKSTREIQADL